MDIMMAIIDQSKSLGLKDVRNALTSRGNWKTGANVRYVLPQLPFVGDSTVSMLGNNKHRSGGGEGWDFAPWR